MAADAVVRCRVSSETKALLRNIAAREQVTESAMVRPLLQTLVRTGATERSAISKSDDTGLRAERLSIRLLPNDRLLLRERASSRGMPSATYVAGLVRSHLRKLTPLPVEELDALKRSIAELGAVGRNLNQIARALNAGGRWDGPGPQHLDAMLKIAVALRDHMRALLKANETSWERGYGQTTD
jgi:hypothetical protein